MPNEMTDYVVIYQRAPGMEYGVIDFRSPSPGLAEAIARGLDRTRYQAWLRGSRLAADYHYAGGPYHAVWFATLADFEGWHDESKPAPSWRRLR